MNQEEIFEAQLAEERAQAKQTKVPKTSSKKTGALKTILKNPFIKFLVPFLGEIGSGGILPGCTGYVIWTYVEEKKSGNPNIAEYLIVGGLAGTADVIGLLGLTGFLLILSYAITVPCLASLFVWRIYKHGLKSALPTKN